MFQETPVTVQVFETKPILVQGKDSGFVCFSVTHHGQPKTVQQEGEAIKN